MTAQDNKSNDKQSDKHNADDKHNANKIEQLKQVQEIDIPDFTTLTPRQQAFVRRYAEAVVDPSDKSTREQIAIDSGYSEHSASAIAYQNLEKPKIARAIQGYLEASGLSPRDLSEKLQKAIEKGLESDRVTVSDALRGIDMALKLHDVYPAERKQVEKRSISYNIEGKDMKAITTGLRELLDEVEEVKRLRSEST